MGATKLGNKKIPDDEHHIHAHLSVFFSMPLLFNDFKILLRIPLTDFAYRAYLQNKTCSWTSGRRITFTSCSNLKGRRKKKHVDVEEKKENSFVLYRVKAGSLLSTVIPLYYAMKRHLVVHTWGLIKFYDLILIFNNGI